MQKRYFFFYILKSESIQAMQLKLNTYKILVSKYCIHPFMDYSCCHKDFKVIGLVAIKEKHVSLSLKSSDPPS